MEESAPNEIDTPSAITTVPWDDGTKRTVLIILLIVVIFFVWLSRSVIPMLIVSGILAYLLKPIVDLGERIRIPRSIGTLIVFALIIFLLILIPVIVVPILSQQLVSLIDYDPNTVVNSIINSTTELVRNAPDNYIIDLPGLPPYDIPIGDTIQLVGDNFNQFIAEYVVIPDTAEIVSYIQQVIGTATNVVGSATLLGVNIITAIVRGILFALVVLIISIYLTKDAPQIRAYIEGLAPKSYKSELMELLVRMGNVWQAFFRGQVTLSVIIGFTTTVSLYLVGMPGALVLGIFAGLMEIIPNLGPTLAMIPAIIVALIQGSNNPALFELGNFGFALVIVGIYFLIQQIENSVVVPRVIGESVNLHPVVVICGVLVGLSVAGVLGAFLAAPLVASMRIIGSYLHAKLLDYPPFLEVESKQRRRVRPTFYRRVVTGDQLKEQKEERSTQDDIHEGPTDEIPNLRGATP